MCGKLIHLLIGLLVATLALGTGAAHASTPWRVVATPNQGTGDNRLNAVAAVSSTNVWAVGSGSDKPLIEHWNGTKWSVVAGATSGQGYLTDVSAPAANNVWADGVGANGPLIEHYDGSRWSVLRSTPPGADGVSGVSALSPTNVWVGATTYAPDNNQSASYLERWNGSSWTAHLIDSGDEEVIPGVVGMKAFSASNVWVISSTTYPVATLEAVDHWNGSTISRSDGPAYPPTSEFQDLYGIGGPAPNDLWVVGQFYDYETPSYGPLAGYWNGSAWISPQPRAYPYCCHSLDAVAGASATNVWAVGHRSYDGLSGSPKYNLLEHWNGSAWAEYGGPNPSSTRNSLAGVAAAPKSTVFWAVGTTGTSPQRTLALRCC